MPTVFHLKIKKEPIISKLKKESQDGMLLNGIISF